MRPSITTAALLLAALIASPGCRTPEAGSPSPETPAPTPEPVAPIVASDESRPDPAVETGETVIVTLRVKDAATGEAEMLVGETTHDIASLRKLLEARVAKERPASEFSASGARSEVNLHIRSGADVRADAVQAIFSLASELGIYRIKIEAR